MSVLFSEALREDWVEQLGTADIPLGGLVPVAELFEVDSTGDAYLAPFLSTQRLIVGVPLEFFLAPPPTSFILLKFLSN